MTQPSVEYLHLEYGNSTLNFELAYGDASGG